MAPAGSEMRVTTPLTLVVAVELPLVDEEVLLRVPLDEPPPKPPDDVGFGEGVRVLDGVGFGGATEDVDWDLVGKRNPSGRVGTPEALDALALCFV